MNLLIKHSLLIVGCSILLISCDKRSPDKQAITKINLKWNKNYGHETIQDACTGLRWALSHIGCRSDFKKVDFTSSDSILAIDLDSLTFDLPTYEALLKLNSRIVGSQEYQHNENIDLGRYLTLLIGSSAHYYEFNQIPNDLKDILEKYELGPNKGRINNSLVSFKHRVLQFSGQDGLRQLFLSTETDSASGRILEYESIEIMENGQLKFGVFDIEGKRKDAGDPRHTRAGKPAKCMWCHESQITPLFSSQMDFDGFMSASDLNDTLRYYGALLKEKQRSLATTVDYSKDQEHTKMELIYISFMEPSARRLSSEWNLPIDSVLRKLEGLKVHRHEEFPFLGELYERKDVDPLAPFESLEVSSSVREKSKKEVNYLR